MKILYTNHIKERIKLRKIEYELPRKIFEQANERFFDIETGHFVAVMEIVAL